MVHTRPPTLQRLWKPHPSANLRIANENRQFRGHAPAGAILSVPAALEPPAGPLSHCFSPHRRTGRLPGTKYRSAPQVARNPCFATHLVLPTGHDIKGQYEDDLSVVDMDEVRAP